MSDPITKAAKKKANAQRDAIDRQERAAAEERKRTEAATEKMQQAVNKYQLPTFLSVPEAQQYKQTIEDRMAGRGLIDVNALTSPISIPEIPQYKKIIEDRMAGKGLIDINAFPESQEYKKMIENRIAGKGLIDINALTSPLAEQRRAGFERTKADINAEASARGLGRSTIPVNRIAEESKAAERDIAERMAQLELARQGQIEQAIGQFGNIAQREIARKAQLELARQGQIEQAVGQFGDIAQRETARKAQLELARQGQIEQAVGQFGNIAQREATSQSDKAQFQRAGELGVAGAQIEAALAAKNNQFAIANSIKEKGASDAASELLKFQVAMSAIIAGAGVATANPALISAGAGGLIGSTGSSNRTADAVIGTIYEHQQNRQNQNRQNQAVDITPTPSYRPIRGSLTSDNIVPSYRPLSSSSDVTTPSYRPIRDYRIADDLIRAIESQQQNRRNQAMVART